MMKYLLALTIICAVAFSSCSGSDTDNGPGLKKKSYVYSLTDSSSVVLAEGTMDITSISKSTVTGMRNTYDVKGTYTVGNVTTDTMYTAFSTMTGGEMTGLYNDSLKTIWINTNPSIADANVFINANVTSSKMKGDWYFSTFRGKDKQGGFFNADAVAKKKN